MSVDQVREELRTKDAFHHIDAGFLNRRLAMRALPPPMFQFFSDNAEVGADHFTQMRNDYLLVTILEDLCEKAGIPPLLEALETSKQKLMFRSTEKLAPCPEIYNAERVEHEVELPLDFGTSVKIVYNTKHLVSDTGKMTLAEGSPAGYVQSIIGVVHKSQHSVRVEPIVIGAPWFDHPRNGDDRDELMWLGMDFGEILPEDISEFSKAREIEVSSSDEWMNAMRSTSEADVKRAITSILREPPKKDWGGETDDHFSANVTVGGRRRTAAFLFKGPTSFREMTLDMCGKRADQIHRLARTSADVLVVQHSHQIGDIVRETLRALVIQPGGKSRKYCLIDGMSTYQILKAYDNFS